MNTNRHESEKKGRLLSKNSCLFVFIRGFIILLFLSARIQAEELIPDNGFQRGFVLDDPKPGAHVRYGELRGLETNSKPAWSLLQWSSKFPLATNPIVQLGGTLIYSNAAKSVTIAPNFLALAVNSAVEYGPHARAQSDPWIHLLVEEQRFPHPPKLSELKSAKLHVQARLARANKISSIGFNPDIHAAQFQIFFTVQNLNPKSPGHGDLLWFGVPIYDNRSDFPPAFHEQDWGGTAKFIYTPDGKTFTANSAHNGKWITLEADLLPLMREALNTAWARGFLLGSKNLGDYYIGGMNMGWEVTGHFDVEMQVRKFGLEIKK